MHFHRKIVQYTLTVYLTNIFVFQEFVWVFSICYLSIFVWVCRVQVVFCVWKLKDLLLVTFKI